MNNSGEPLSGRHVIRTSWACERCRSLKARCLPGTREGLCQRCAKFETSCIWSGKQPKRGRRATSRIVQDTGAQLTNGGVRQQASVTRYDRTNQGADPCHSVNSSRSGLARSAQTGQSRPAGRTNTLEDMPRLHKFDLSAGNEQASTSQSTKCTLDEGFFTTILHDSEIDELFEEYRGMQHSFPFVPLMDDVTAQSLRKKPILFLAILTVSSWRYRQLQLRLEKLFRTEFADRTLVNPRKDIVLLQSALVYLAWSQYFFDAKLQNAASVMHLAVAIVYDLGLLVSQRAAPQSATSDSGENVRRRAVLGCYFLSSTITNEYHRPALLKCSVDMLRWCQQFSDQPEFDTDTLIGLLVESRRILDLVHEYSATSNLEEERLFRQFQNGKHRLDEWSTQPQRDEHRRLLSLVWSSLELKLYSRLSQVNRELRRRKELGDDFDTKQIERNAAHLNAGKSFLSALVATPISDSFMISFVEWTYLPRIIMELARLSIHDVSHPPGWDAERAQERIQLGLYLDSLCYRMQNLTTVDSTQPSPDYWFILKAIMQSVSEWYQKKVKEGISRIRNDRLVTTTSNAPSRVPFGADPQSLSASQEFQQTDPLISLGNSLFIAPWTHLDFSDNLWTSNNGLEWDFNAVSFGLDDEQNA